MTTEEAPYSINQVQKIIQSGIQNEMVAWCQEITDENAIPNIAPPTHQPLNLQMP